MKFDHAAGAVTGIDHTLVGVRDLEAARRTWDTLGFTLTPRGRHIGWGTGNYCVMLESGYIELLGVVDPSQFLNNLDGFLQKREGLMGLAFGTEDSAACAAALKSAGVVFEGPKGLKRKLEMPEGEGLPAFELLYLDREATVTVEIYDITGVRRALLTETFPYAGADLNDPTPRRVAGLIWDGRDAKGEFVPYGIYILRVIATYNQAGGTRTLRSNHSVAVIR